MLNTVIRGLVVALFCAASSAHAALVEWTLHNASFGEGGIASGFFVVNTDDPGADPIVSNDFHIVTTTGTTGFVGRDYSPATSGGTGLQIYADHVGANDLLGGLFTFLVLTVDGDLRHTKSGILGLVPQSSSENQFGTFRTLVDGGTISAAVVPEPSALFMLVAGVAVLIGRFVRTR